MSPKQGSLTYTEYLALEQLSGKRLEFANGYTFPSPAADKLHNLIVGKLSVEIATHLLGKGYDVTAGSTKVIIPEAANATYYPDVVVLSANHPILLIEVLAPLTSSLDRREKLFSYQKIPSLQEYVIIYTNEIYAEHHHTSNLGWEVDYLGIEHLLTLESIHLAIALSHLYEATA
ncbi:MAG: Uma2 family endonuclease [Oscillatoriales cyanobacterium SM2_2_1]|nr:Uma2 family endonuclease [Oscillatoriales cyanobacterium SM2_2_1]